MLSFSKTSPCAGFPRSLAPSCTYLHILCVANNVWTLGRQVPAEAVHALTALTLVPQTTPGRYFHLPDTQTLRGIMAHYYDVYPPVPNTNTPVLTDPYFDAFGNGVLALGPLFWFVVFLCTVSFHLFLQRSRYVLFMLTFPWYIVVHVLINADTGGVLAVEQNIICCQFLSWP